MVSHRFFTFNPWDGGWTGIFNKTPGMTLTIPIDELTPRELEVLKLIAEEFTTADISEQLHITINTVESHRRNLLTKFGARNSAGLIRRAMRLELLD